MSNGRPNSKPKKAVILGPSGAGKTAIVERLLHPNQEIKLEEIRSTVGVECCGIEQAGARFEIWDTSGADRYSSLISMYAKKADLLIFVINEDCPEEKRKDWLEKIPGQLKDAEIKLNCPCLLIVTPQKEKDSKAEMDSKTLDLFRKELNETLAANRLKLQQANCLSCNAIKQGKLDELIAKMSARCGPGASNSTWEYINAQFQTYHKHLRGRMVKAGLIGEDELNEVVAAEVKLNEKYTEEKHEILEKYKHVVECCKLLDSNANGDGGKRSHQEGIRDLMSYLGESNSGGKSVADILEERTSGPMKTFLAWLKRVFKLGPKPGFFETKLAPVEGAKLLRQVHERLDKPKPR